MDNRPLTIKKAALEYFGDELGPDGFRAWARAAGVRIMRVGRKDFVFPRQCQDALDRLASSSTSNAEPGSSGMGLSGSEQVLALKAKLRLVSPNTSRDGSSPRRTRPQQSARS